MHNFTFSKEEGMVYLSIIIILCLITFLLISCASDSKPFTGTQETYTFDELPEAATPSSTSFAVSAYLRTWKLEEDPRTYWTADRIRGDMLTEVNVSFATITEDDDLEFATVDDDGSALKKQIALLRKKFPQLLVTLSIGGGGAGGFSEMANVPSKRAAFVSNVISFIQEYQFTGVDVDWEYPVGPDWGQSITSCPEDRTAYVLLLADLRTAFTELGKTTGMYYTLSTAIPDLKWFIQKNDVCAAAKICDCLKIMCYDFYGSWSGTTGHNGNLYLNPEDPDHWGAALGIQAYIDAGVAPEKLVYGMPFYAVVWSDVADNNVHGLFQKYKTFVGTVQNSDIAEKFSDGFTRYWDDASKAAWLYDGKTFVSYTDETAIKEIVAFARDKKLGGVMYWEYGHDMDAEWLSMLNEAVISTDKE